MVKLFDVRTGRALPPIPFPSGPVRLVAHPSKQNTCLIVSAAGQFHIVDPSDVNTAVGFHSMSDLRGAIVGADISKSGEVIAFVDDGGFIQLWSHVGSSASFNDVARFPVWPEVPKQLPLFAVDDYSKPLGSIGVPYYEERLASAWPVYLPTTVGEPPIAIPKNIEANLKTIDFIGYAKWNRVGDDGVARLRNQANIVTESIWTSFNTPLKKSAASKLSQHDNHSLEVMPKHYRKMEIKYTRFGIEDFNFAYIFLLSVSS